MSSVLDLGTPCAPNGVGNSLRSCLKGATGLNRGHNWWSDINDEKPVIEKIVVEEEYGARLQIEKEKEIREKGRKCSAVMFETAGRVFDMTKGDLGRVKLYIQKFRAEINKRLKKCLDEGDQDGVIFYKEIIKAIGGL